ncbi:TetR/AcrR family transcriptional regulator [Rhodococcus sp. NPDC004095]
MGGNDEKSPGRPRDPERHRAVLDATRSLLAEEGYDALTLAAVARRAGVGRPLLYQWWGSKAALVQEALFARQARGARPDPSMSFTDTVTAMIREMVEHQSRAEYRRGLPGLVADMVADPELQRRADEEFIAPIRDRYAEVFARGVEAGEVRPDVDGAAVLDTLRGAVMMHTLAGPALDGEALVRHLADLVLNGVRLHRT